MPIFRFDVCESFGEREMTELHWLTASSIEEAQEKISARMACFYSHAELVNAKAGIYSTGDLEYSATNAAKVTREELIKELLERSGANDWPVPNIKKEGL